MRQSDVFETDLEGVRVAVCATWNESNSVWVLAVDDRKHLPGPDFDSIAFVHQPPLNAQFVLIDRDYVAVLNQLANFRRDGS